MPGEMHDRVAIARDLERHAPIGEVADDHLLVRFGRVHLADVGEPQATRQRREPGAQVAAEATGRAGDQDALVVGHGSASNAAARSSLSVARGVIASTGTTSSISAPPGDAIARSNAAEKSAVCATVSAWKP